jgi:hypothetical protein
MIALKNISRKIGMEHIFIDSGKVIPEAVMKSFSPKDIEDMKKRKMIVDDRKSYDDIIKAEKAKNDEAIKKGEAVRKKLIASRKPKPKTEEKKVSDKQDLKPEDSKK